MMPTILINTGSLAQLRPLGSEGCTVLSSAAQLKEIIKRKFGEAFANCLADPVPNANGDKIDWYVSACDPCIIPWADMTDAQRQQALQEVEIYKHKILHLAAEQCGQDNPSARTSGRLLQHVVTLPDNASIILVDNKAILTFWGFRHSGQPPAPPRPSRRNIAIGLFLLIAALSLLLFLSPWRDQPEELLVFPNPAVNNDAIDFLSGTWQAISNNLVDSKQNRIDLFYVLDQEKNTLRIERKDRNQIVNLICRTALTVTFADNKLTLQPTFNAHTNLIPCNDGATHFRSPTVTCIPDAHGHAVCTGRYTDGKTFNVTMRRHSNNDQTIRGS